MPSHLEEAEKQILGALLADFTARELSASVLRKIYEGPMIADLSDAICVGDEITSVDFDLALKDLENKKFIKTGPYQSYKNTPGSRTLIFASYSLREYACLTEQGYKAARQPPNRPAKTSKIVNNLHISGGNFNNMQLATGEVISQKMEVTAGADSDTLIKLVTILKEHGQSVTQDQQAELLAAIDQAKSGNGHEAKSILAQVCGPVWNSVQPVMWPILGELVKQSLGL